MAAGLAAVALATAACHLSPYAAIVNGQMISQQDLHSELQAINSNKAYVNALQSGGGGSPVQGKAPGSFDMRFVDAVLNRQILYALVNQELARRDVTITPDDLSLARADAVATYGGKGVFDAFPPSYRQDLVRHSAEVTALESSLSKVDVSKAALHRYYDSHTSQFRSICASIILVKSLPKAQSVEAALHAGASFSQLAQSESQDAGTKASGGRVGCALPQAYATSFGQALASALAALAPGHVAAPVHTQAGWVVAEVTSATQVPFSQATPSIRAALLQGSAPKVNSFLTKLVRGATIEVDPRYGHFTTSGPNAGLQPPPVPPASALVLPNGIAGSGNGAAAPAAGTSPAG